MEKTLPVDCLDENLFYHNSLATSVDFLVAWLVTDL